MPDPHSKKLRMPALCEHFCHCARKTSLFGPAAVLHHDGGQEAKQTCLCSLVKDVDLHFMLSFHGSLKPTGLSSADSRSCKT